MNSLRHLLFAASSVLLGSTATAQRSTLSTELKTFSEQRIKHQKTLGLTLGSFALANIAVGAVAAGQTSGETKYFHKMNVYWNLVNLGIAGAGLLGSRKRNANSETLADAVRQHENMKQILLINAGLDVAYVVGGAYLRERAESHPDKADQLRGYGKSIMAQGGFLLAFDLVNYFIFKNRGDKQERLLLSAGQNGLGIVLPIR
ncbi:DUF6992 family protein [Spirosoma endophyticum]|uniref:DUF4134 domain-containing protein n=1 Tax=Spirosoma endophyticum TaxID=662367 RepID=A0A1I2CUG5_9BACT|nr:hypothetical protein [Spirosoma endophyticum]SFE71898.1 hypothetical protein SAMN05216167_11857 [Spirosoma endophyticum]